jgi:hypothetical protein
MQNLGTLQKLSLGDLADDGREEREIMPSLMATSLRWRTHSARINLVPIIGVTGDGRNQDIGLL